MPSPPPKKTLKPIEQCPDGHDCLEEKDYACGWLVCIKGTNKGRAYTIKDGKNFIGSSTAMDIQIIGDGKIEKKNHAVIMYDSRQKKTMLLPADSRGMVYWQGQAIFEPKTLEPFDSIEFGESAFKYAPFCNEDFSWEDQKEE